MHNLSHYRKDWGRKAVVFLVAVSMIGAAFGGVVDAQTVHPVRAPSPSSVHVVEFSPQNLSLTPRAQVLTPENPVYAFDLDVPAGLVLTAAELHVFFRYSPVLIGQESSIIASVDNIPVATQLLIPKRSTNASLAVAIPVQDLTPSPHAVTLTVQLRSQRNLCNDDDSQENWLVVLPTSFIHFTPTNDGPLPSLARFPFPFVQPYQPTSQWHNVVDVPQNPTNTDLTAAYGAVTALARSASAGVQMQTIVPGTIPPRATPIVYVASWKDVPRAWQEAIHAGAGLLEELVQRHHTGPSMVLFVTGQTGSEVLLAAAALQHHGLMSQLPGNQAWITSGMLRRADQHARGTVVRGTTPLEDIVPLSQLGYGQTVLTGQQAQVATFSLTTPLTWRYRSGAGFHLALRNSSLLGNTSAVIVSVDNEPMASHTLDAATASGLRMFVPFPSNLPAGQPVTVTVDAKTSIPHTSCDVAPNDLRPYVRISPSSGFSLPHSIHPSLALANFPSLFVTPDNRLDHVTVLMPKHPTAGVLTALARVMAGYAGTYQGSVTVKTFGRGPLPSGNLWIVDANGTEHRGNVWQTLPIAVTARGLTSRRLPLSSEAVSDGAVVEQAYRLHGAGAIWLLGSAPAAHLTNIATWFAGHRLPYQADSAVLVRIQGVQNVLLDMHSAPFERSATRVRHAVARAYRLTRIRVGHMVIDALAFLLSLGSVLAYLLWTLFRCRPHSDDPPRDPNGPKNDER